MNENRKSFSTRNSGLSSCVYFLWHSSTYKYIHLNQASAPLWNKNRLLHSIQPNHSNELESTWVAQSNIYFIWCSEWSMKSNTQNQFKTIFLWTIGNAVCWFFNWISNNFHRLISHHLIYTIEITKLLNSQNNFQITPL